jgi:hypothetical protein
VWNLDSGYFNCLAEVFTANLCASPGVDHFPRVERAYMHASRQLTKCWARASIVLNWVANTMPTTQTR